MKATTILTTALLSTLSLTALAGNKTHISSIMANGSGCPMVTPDVKVSGDTIQIWTEDLKSSINSEDRFDRQNCQVTLNIASVPGWYYELDQIKVNGTAHVGNGVEGTVTLAAYHQGELDDGVSELSFDGYKKSSFTLKNKAPLVSSCEDERALNINTAVRLLNRNSNSGWGSMKANDKVSLRISWKRCP